LDEKAKYQPWIYKEEARIWMKRPNLDENRIKIEEILILHP
jgi:hypothetical protein